jgi:hypothetical protein
MVTKPKAKVKIRRVEKNPWRIRGLAYPPVWRVYCERCRAVTTYRDTWEGAVASANAHIKIAHS